ncbi:hypothetical protein BLA39750_07118 [Burkholderia lata]|uniref:Uncharacterized protein n=1 Tax=Burkholderia lata (strain ATCC 17760 / DSM 23089 / LMG 22485 / NCIMB 9086 / R18194 / 383) TaxID=482957 RepID=A0A6P3BK13_BURL3|nr:hypothetical protein BLA39750_07118 [Burkholderia lata]
MLPAHPSHIVVPVQRSARPEASRGTRTPFDACDPRNSPDETPCATAPALFPTELPFVGPALIPSDPAHRRSVEREVANSERLAGSPPALWIPHPPPPHRPFDCSSGTYPLVVNRRCIGLTSHPKNKSGVFHVKHAARFPPTAPSIKPFSSPTRGTFRSRADSAPARLPALPAQTRPSPAHSRSRRSAAQPAHSARSAASPRPYRATH